ncbi:MAG: hypothetical protein IJT97_05150 [Bacteroidaceae bacterium]|nr:hypothetical protein [Bacteroidaceae bacterium]
MKTTVFTLMTAFVLSTTTVLAQPRTGRSQYQNNSGRQTYTERRGNVGRDDMYGMGSRQDRHQPQGNHNGMAYGHNRGGRDVVVVHQPPRVVTPVVYSQPVPPPPVVPVPAPCPVPPPPPVHVSPAGVVAGAVIGTVIGAILSH